jgi:hypothetical protein
MNAKKELLLCEDLETIKTPSSFWSGFFGGLGAAGIIGGMAMGALITFSGT